MKRVVFLIMVVLLGVGVYAQEGEYVDLGLSSETKWKNVNANSGGYTHEKAMALFGDKMPSKAQWEELIEECKWTWEDGESVETTGCRVTGPNGNSIFLPAEGGYFGPIMGVRDMMSVGIYWSSSYNNVGEGWCVSFYSGNVYMSNEGGPDYGFSVRLVKD